MESKVIKESEKEDKNVEFMFSHKKTLFIIITLIIFFMLIIQFSVYHIPIIIDLHLPCIDYLEQGVLYEGQPQCMHGPIFYVIIAPFRLLFGENYFLILAMFNAIIYAITFFILIKIIEKEKIKSSVRIVSFFFIFLIVLPFVDNLGELYSMPLLLMAYYYIFYSSWRYKDIVVGIIFALLIHIKMNNLVFIVLLSFFYLLKEIKTKEIKEVIKKASSVIMAIIVITGLMIILFPNVLKFTLISNIEGEKESIGTTIEYVKLFLMSPYKGNGDINKYIVNVGTLFKKTAFIDPQIIFFYIFIPLTAMMWWRRKKDPATAILFFGFWSIFLLSFRNFDQFTFRYMFPILPFLVIGILKELYEERKWKWILNISILIMIFALTQFTNAYGWYGWGQEIQDQEFLELRELVEKSYGFLPANMSILTDNKRILEINGYEVNESFITEFPRKRSLEELSIHPYTYNLDKIGVLSERWKVRDNLGVEHINEVAEQIIKKKYDIIIYIPKSHIETLLALIIKKLEKERSSKVDLKGVGYECNVENIPTLELQCFGCKYLRNIIFKDEAICKEFVAKGLKYYKKVFNEICEKDEFIANELLMTEEGVSCNSGKDVLIRKTGKGIFNSWNDVLILAGILIMGSWILYKRG
ncbi:MAG TPA: hypothetical protein VJH37_01730 [Candidatus Nanoarchaeia archaeon]|nr:hypothetical protein [Candidatus Nanoarchaeia archaeon]